MNSQLHFGNNVEKTLIKLCEYFLEESLKIDENLTTVDEDLKKLTARLKTIRSSFEQLRAKEAEATAVTSAITSAAVRRVATAVTSLALHQNTTDAWFDEIKPLFNFVVESVLLSFLI